jgi:uncharacterized repeat protein (TIGR02543 family)
MSVILYILLNSSRADDMNYLTLNLNINSKSSVRNRHSKNTFFSLISLLFVIVLLSSAIASTFTIFSTFASGASVADVTVGTESALRIEVSNAVSPKVIALTADITLTGSALNIPAGKDITLVSDKAEGFWKLAGATNQVTISVDGKLTLDGIIVTHVSGVNGGGVLVNTGGVVTMDSGVIANNTAVYGSSDSCGGVYVLYGGDFSLSGGMIVNNTARDGGGVYACGSFEMSGDAVVANNTAWGDGGGVYIYGNTFTMSDSSSIVYNTASNGGGVYLFFSASLVMSGGVIADNTATGSGGGVHIFVGSFSLSGSGVVANNTAQNGGGVYIFNGGIGGSLNLSGVIANNTARSDGGGVYVDFSESLNVILSGGKVYGNVAFGNGGGIGGTGNSIAAFERLFVGENVVFSDNRASVAYSRDSVHDGVYNAMVKGTVWSSPFTQGYNNYDISYTTGTLLTYMVSVSGNYSTPSGAGSYLNGTSITVNAGSRSGYTFSGWTITEGGITVSNSATATFTMPARNVAITANWTPVTSGGDGGDGGSSSGGGGSSSKPSPSPSTPTPSEPTPSTPSPSPSPSDSGNIESKFPITTVLVLVIVALVIVVLAVVWIVVWLLRKGSKA